MQMHCSATTRFHLPINLEKLERDTTSPVRWLKRSRGLTRGLPRDEVK